MYLCNDDTKGEMEVLDCEVKCHDGRNLSSYSSKRRLKSCKDLECRINFPLNDARTEIWIWFPIMTDFTGFGCVGMLKREGRGDVTYIADHKRKEQI